MKIRNTISFQFYQNKKINRVALPTYGWNWKVYWENPVRQSLVISHQALVNSNKSIENNKSEITNDQLPITIKPIATRETLLAYMQIEAAKVLGLEAGQKVEHQKFGFGIVKSMEGSAHNPVATIDFGVNGEKKIMLNYAKLRIVS